MLYRNIIAVCSDSHTKTTDAVYKHKIGLILMLNVVLHKVTTGL